MQRREKITLMWPPVIGCGKYHVKQESDGAFLFFYAPETRLYYREHYRDDESDAAAWLKMTASKSSSFVGTHWHLAASRGTSGVDVWYPELKKSLLSRRAVIVFLSRRLVRCDRVGAAGWHVFWKPSLHAPPEDTTSISISAQVWHWVGALGALLKQLASDFNEYA